MNRKNELKIVNTYLKLADKPAAYSRKYSILGTISYVIGWFCIFGSTLAYLQNHENILLISIVGFIGGGSIVLGIWFKQIAIQVQILSAYLSKDKLDKRAHELST